MQDQNLISRVATRVWKWKKPGGELSHPDREVPKLHLTWATAPRYAVDHARLAVRRRRYGIEGQPWITVEAKALLETMLKPTDVGVEFGSGGSTEWLAARVGTLTSIEAHDPWYQHVVKRLADKGLANVEVVLVSSETLGYETPAHQDAYINVCPDLAPGSLDFVFDDGEYRDDVALRSLDLVRPGGLFVLDNANMFLPAPSRTPWKLSEPATAKWAEFSRAVEGWRVIWTTNGVWDTALWVKP